MCNRQETNYTSIACAVHGAGGDLTNLSVEILHPNFTLTLLGGYSSGIEVLASFPGPSARVYVDAGLGTRLGYKPEGAAI